MVIPCCILRGFANAIHLFADGVDLDVLRSVVARPAAAHQHDGARVEGGQDRAQGREFMIAAHIVPQGLTNLAAVTKKTNSGMATYGVWLL